MWYIIFWVDYIIFLVRPVCWCLYQHWYEYIKTGRWTRRGFLSTYIIVIIVWNPRYTHIFIYYSHKYVCTKYVSHGPTAMFTLRYTDALSKGVSDTGGAHVLIDRFFGRRLQVYTIIMSMVCTPKPECPYTTNTHLIIIIICVPRWRSEREISRSARVTLTVTYDSAMTKYIHHVKITIFAQEATRQGGHATKLSTRRTATIVASDFLEPIRPLLQYHYMYC